MLKIVFNFIVLLSVSLHAEQSMFGAGDLESSEPYGLTSAEKVIIKNKTVLKKNETKLKKVDTVVRNIDERIDGIESVVEGESIKLNKLSKSFKKHLDEVTLVNSKNQEKLSQINGTTENLQFQIEQNRQNITTLKGSIDKLAELINTINSDYVAKKEFKELISILDKKEKTSTKKTKVKSSKSMMKEARTLFKKDYFTKAIPILNELIKRNYRPAESNYYLGEINYYRKNYQDALHYFKISMTLYDKAKYLPKLLLHSAISFENIGDKENATNFYNTIIDVYPESNEAKEASKKIKY